MLNAVLETKLVAHEKAVEAAGIAIALVMRVPAPLKSIADQVIRSASSVPAVCSGVGGNSKFEIRNRFTNDAEPICTNSG